MGQWQSTTRKMNNHFQSAGEGLQAGQWFNSAMVNGERCYTAPLYLSPSYSSYENILSPDFRAYSWLDYNSLTDVIGNVQDNGSFTIFGKIAHWKEERLSAAVWSNTQLSSGVLNGETVSIPFTCPVIRPTVYSDVIGIAIIGNNYLSSVPSWITNGANTVTYFETNDFVPVDLGVRVPYAPAVDRFVSHNTGVLQRRTIFPSGWEGVLYDDNSMLNDCGVSFGAYGEVGKQGYQNNDLSLDGRVSYWNSGVYGVKDGNEFQTVRCKTGFLPVATMTITGYTYANSQVVRGFITQISGNPYHSYRGALGAMYYNYQGGKLMPYYGSSTEWLLNNEPFGVKVIKDDDSNVVGTIMVFVNHRISSIDVQGGVTLIS